MHTGILHEKVGSVGISEHYIFFLLECEGYEFVNERLSGTPTRAAGEVYVSTHGGRRYEK